MSRRLVSRLPLVSVTLFLLFVVSPSLLYGQENATTTGSGGGSSPPAATSEPPPSSTTGGSGGSTPPPSNPPAEPAPASTGGSQPSQPPPAATSQPQPQPEPTPTPQPTPTPTPTPTTPPSGGSGSTTASAGTPTTPTPTPSDPNQPTPTPTPSDPNQPTTGGSNQPPTQTPSPQIPIEGGSTTPTPPPPSNNEYFIVNDGNATCGPAIPENTCFFGVSVNFQQTCKPACYWGGLCHNNRCTKQKNDCLFFCPENYSCSYGFCVANTILPKYLTTLVPYLYTTNALIQPSDPNSQPLYEGDGKTPTDGDEAGIGGQYNSADATHASFALTVALGMLAVAFGR
jgi:hypothetical protein